MSENRRKFMRINGDSAECVVQLGVSQATGVLINESIDGFRIGDLELLLLIADQKVTILHQDMQVIGRCRSVSRDSNGRFQIGVYREQITYQPETKTILLNSFMRFDNSDVVCVPLAVLDENRVRIRLMDGSEFTVRRDQMLQITRDERERELRNVDKLQRLQAIYGTMDGTRSWQDSQDILLHEFGPPLKALV